MKLYFRENTERSLLSENWEKLNLCNSLLTYITGIYDKVSFSYLENIRISHIQSTIVITN